jgi:hypothetical protein
MSYGLGIGIAGLPLLGIAGPSLKQGAAGVYFEPVGVLFRDGTVSGLVGGDSSPGAGFVRLQPSGVCRQPREAPMS